MKDILSNALGGTIAVVRRLEVGCLRVSVSTAAGCVTKDRAEVKRLYNIDVLSSALTALYHSAQPEIWKCNKNHSYFENFKPRFNRYKLIVSLFKDFS